MPIFSLRYAKQRRVFLLFWESLNYDKRSMHGLSLQSSATMPLRKPELIRRRASKWLKLGICGTEPAYTIWYLILLFGWAMPGFFRLVANVVEILLKGSIFCRGSFEGRDSADEMVCGERSGAERPLCRQPKVGPWCVHIFSVNQWLFIWLLCQTYQSLHWRVHTVFGPWPCHDIS